MQPKTLTLVFDDAVNDLACIRVRGFIRQNFKKIRSFPSPYRSLKFAYLKDSDWLRFFRHYKKLNCILLQNLDQSKYCELNASGFHCGWIPRLIAHLKKKFLAIPDFLIAFGSPIDTNIMNIFGFGRGSPRWA